MWPFIGGSPADFVRTRVPLLRALLASHLTRVWLMVDDRPPNLATAAVLPYAVHHALPRTPSDAASDVSDYLDVERSLSLHSALKKPNRTPAEKKVVHFADSLGLDLCQVQPLFYNSSDDDIFGSTPPIIVKSAQHYSAVNTTNKLPYSGSFHNARYLHLQQDFCDPVNVQREILKKAHANNVVLKQSNVIGMTFTGVVLVANLDFHKQVHIRYTLDGWRNFTDVTAHYTSTMREENLDNFNFSIFLPQSIPVGAKCEFAIRFKCRGAEYWDNNAGKNYVLECRSIGGEPEPEPYHQPRFY